MIHSPRGERDTERDGDCENALRTEMYREKQASICVGEKNAACRGAQEFPRCTGLRSMWRRLLC